MQTHAVAIATGLAARGHDVLMLTYRHDQERDQAREFDRGRPYRTLRELSRLSIWASIGTAADHIDRYRPDAVVASTTFYGAIGRVRAVPVICRSVGNDVMRCWVPYPFEFGSAVVGAAAVERRALALYRRFRAPGWVEDVLLARRRQFVQDAARQATLVLANSNYTRDRLLEAGVQPDRVQVVVGGVDAARFADPDRRIVADPGGQGPRLLTVCRLVVKKGIDVLLRATALVSASAPGATLTIVGDGPERGECERLAASLGIASRVRFVGRVPHPAMPGYYHDADIFVLASRIHVRKSGWADVETMGRVICEANAAGVPVIASRTGGVPALIRSDETGILVEPDYPLALAAAIQRLWASPDRRAAMAAAGLVRARREFDWSAVLDRYEGALAEVTRARRG